MRDTFLTIEGTSRVEIKIKHSRFIATAKHIESREEASEFLQSIQKEFSDATHNCYAYCADIKGFELKFSDNGEPSGTAGKPILDVIQKNDLRQICIVVTRYFGGIKLGASGLVGAYSASSANVVEQSQKVRMDEGVEIILELPYVFCKKTESLLNNFDANIKDREYSTFVKIVAILPKNSVDIFKSKFIDETGGNGKITLGKEVYIKVFL